MSLFGPKAINAFVLPLALDYWKQWNDDLSRVSGLETRMEVHMCQQATLSALCVFLGSENQEAPESMGITWDSLEETFGDSLVILSCNNTEYTMSFV